MKNIHLFIIAIFLVSCNTFGPKKPKDLLSKTEMINLIYDIHLANKTLNILPLDSIKNKNYLSVVSQKYETDTIRFKASHEYYMYHIIEYREIYDSVFQRIDKKLKVLERKVHLIDSIEKLKKTKTKQSENLKKRSRILKKNLKKISKSIKKK